MHALLRLLCEEGCAVRFFAENLAHDGHYTVALQQLGVEAWWHPWIGDVPAWLREHGPRLDLIVASRHYVLSPLLRLLREYAPQAQLVFDTVDLHFLREEREAAQTACCSRQVRILAMAETGPSTASDSPRGGLTAAPLIATRMACETGPIPVPAC